jgi:hypothetical protein
MASLLTMCVGGHGCYREAAGSISCRKLPELKRYPRDASWRLCVPRPGKEQVLRLYQAAETRIGLSLDRPADDGADVSMGDLVAALDPGT